MKIIFLDIDGVLCIGKCHNLPKINIADRFEFPLDQECIENLNKITDATGALIVISSAWRIDFWDPDEFVLLTDFFKEMGATGKIIGHTPYSHCGVRGSEIQMWLDDHKDVSSFVIIDDSSDMIHLMPKLIRTDFEVGLQGGHAAQAIEMLNGEKIV